MSEKRTLEKCRKIMQMFDKQKYKPSSALKEKPVINNSVQLSNYKQKNIPTNTHNNSSNRVSFCLPAKRNERSHSKNSLRPSFNKSTCSINSAQKSHQHSRSASKSETKKFTSIYNTESRYEKIMKLKVKPKPKLKEDHRGSYLNSSKVSFRSSVSSMERSQPKQSRLDRIMKLKVHKPQVDSTLKNYQPSREERRVIHKQNFDENSVLELKKCKQKIRKESKQADKQDRLWKVFQRERQLRLRQKQRNERSSYDRERSLQKRFDSLVQKELKKIQFQKELEERREQGFSTYLFPSY